MRTRTLFILILAATMLPGSSLRADNTVVLPDMPVEEEDEDTGEDADAVRELPRQQSDRQVIYDLQGRRVAHPQPGHIYIIAGKKVLVTGTGG